MNRAIVPAGLVLAILVGFIIVPPKSTLLSGVQEQLVASAQPQVGVSAPALTANPAFGPAALTAFFTTSPLSYTSSNDTYTLSFGDGTSTMLVAQSGCTQTPGSTCTYNLNHIYVNPGVYAASLVRQYGCSATSTPCMQALPGATVLIVASGGSGPTVVPSLSSGAVTQTGAVRISWTSTNAPSDATVSFELFDEAGQNYGTIADHQTTTGSYSWIVPAGNATTSMRAIVPGEYEVVAKMYASQQGTTTAATLLDVSAPAHLTIVSLPTPRYR